MKGTSILTSVLLVDDNDADNFIHRLNLECSGMVETVHEVLYAQDALEYLSSHDVDLIFLDVRMPRMNGFEFLQAYRDLAVSQRAAVVLLTSSLAPLDQERSSLFPEIFTYCLKPLTREGATNILQALALVRQNNQERAVS